MHCWHSWTCIEKERARANFEIFLAICQCFLLEIWGCDIPWRRNWEHQRAIHESFLCENLIFHQFAKVFSCQSFPLCGICFHWHCSARVYLPGLHLEIDPRGDEMSIYEKERGRSPVYMCISTCTLGGSLDFRLSETASGAFSGALY